MELIKQKKLRDKIKRALQKSFAIKIILVMLFQCVWPTTALALTGGPSQPEVQSFEPVGVSDMVDLFSGDFSYNIPLFDIDGYPVNISYHSGISMEQEASWVGLGWNINPGAINRNMRGLPDDFNGDEVVKEQNMKKNQTVGISCGYSGELFGFDKANFTARLGIKYNNYTGVGIERSFNVALSSSNKYGGSGCVSLGITSSSEDGLSLQPSVSLSQSVGKTEKSTKLGVSLGASFNSRAGLSSLTIKPDITQNLGVKNKSSRMFKSASLPSGGSTFNFGQQCYSPSLDFPMENLSITANFKFGLEASGYAGSIAPGGYYMEQGQLTKSIASPAYGYMNAHNGQKNPLAMMDFNREKDGSFTRSTYNLPITNLTYDLYSVSGQGTGGSYRPFRSDVGHVFDIASYSTSDGYSGSVEMAAGNLFKGGTDLVVNSAYSQSGDWSSSKAYENTSFQSNGPNADYEPFYFKEANEKSVNSDPAFVSRYGGFGATKYEINGDVEFDAKATGKLKNLDGTLKEVSPSDQRKRRDKRSQTITVLTNREVYEGMGLFGGSAGSGVKNNFVNGNMQNIGHHIGQITSMNTDGKRYVYAIPVYNKEQQEVTFAVGKPVGGGSARTSIANGLVTYSPGQDNSLKNKMGLDNYFSNTKMPPFAHSYLLTAVLSSDYVDVDGNGPTDNDLGNFTLFDYTEIADYKWRTPVDRNKAKFSQGLLADINDDKASYVYGVKQLYFLNTISTKNQIAEFHKSNRFDGYGVNDENGGITNGAGQFCLHDIEVKSKATGYLIKGIEFEYNYDLCTNTSNSKATAYSNGKLTLQKLFFYYQDTRKTKYNSYDFKYNTNVSSENPTYVAQNMDRWGNYKRANPISHAGVGPQLDYFPYTNQYCSQTTNDEDASVWSLKEIKLPSGGKIKIDYEADDYAFVQNKQASQMYLFSDPLITTQNQIIGSNFNFSLKIPTDALGPIVKIEDLLPDDKMVFFKFKMLIKQGTTPSNDLYDYVPGYAEVDIANSSIVGTYAKIAFVPVTLDDNTTNSPTMVSPIVKAALQYGRLNVPRVAWNQPNASASIGQQVVSSLVNSSFFSTIQQAVMGPNKFLYGNGTGKFVTADLSNSWIKLKNINGKKIGGGSRVKKIILNDDFNTMTGEESSEYGQVYTYTTKDNKGRLISSGVASYEPQLGGEENSLREPFFTETKKLLAPDDEHYCEAPFGESFYPSASVGYSAVKVENYYPDPSNFSLPFTNVGIDNHKTGYVLNEFYTAKDFPTISERTDLEAIEHKTNPFDIKSLFNVETRNHMTVSQGFYVELNDMHGKSKAVRTFNNRNQLISSVEYYYKSSPYGKTGSKRLTNNVTLINPNGGVQNGEVGVFFDAVGDLREQSTESQTNGVNINCDIIFVGFPVMTVVPIPSFANDKTQFRSASMTKVVQRFGILEKTISKLDGSTVTSSDLAYDSESGEVLLSQTINGFNDPVYNFKFPAYWYYDRMGPVYKNIDYTQTLNLINGSASLPQGNNLFVEGDEVELQTIPLVSNTAINYYKVWITKSQKDQIQTLDASGNVVPNDTYVAKVIRSGRRNMQTMEMANVVSMINPIGSIRSNVYNRVISAKAIEYQDKWNINCKCLIPSGNNNPYVFGLQDNWKPLRNYEYLGLRGQTNANGNSDIRNDGFYVSYNPFYRNFGGKWKLNAQGWTFVSEVSEASPYGVELETKDALGRYNSNTYGFNQTLITASASNSKYREMGFESFEQNSNSCTPDEHFRWPFSLLSSNAHTGRYSMYVDYRSSYIPGVTYTISTSCSKPNLCPGNIVFDPSSLGGRYVIADAQAPYTFEVDKISGYGDIIISNDGLGFALTSGATLQAIITVKDNIGCIYIKEINAP
jgi:hypothetical protein